MAALLKKDWLHKLTSNKCVSKDPSKDIWLKVQRHEHTHKDTSININVVLFSVGNTELIVT